MRTSKLILALLSAVALSACVSPLSKQCANGLVCPDGTRCASAQAVCIKDSCGNGVVDSNAGEVCDDGNVVSGDGCAADCKSTEGCGNGVIDSATGEVCDDGNTVSGDGCSADCKSKEGCGNGVVDSASGEVCDDANNVSGDGCSADCKSKEVCGNGVVDSAVGEVCDDGNTVSGDGCSADCKSSESCGNGILDKAKGEVCDDGNNVDCDGCSANCKSDEKCGNGYVDNVTCHGLLLELCDDGNNVSGDGCAADCKSEEHCDNGVVDHGEQCDPGPFPQVETAQCNSNCTVAFCGDKIKNITAGEQCDEGGETATCNSNCKSPTCGDGIINTHFGEQCDTLGGADSSICNGSAALAKGCRLSQCGDGYPNAAAGEQCDTAGQSPTCEANCKSIECGDGIINTGAGEACDDGNKNANDGCDTGCHLEAGFACSTQPSGRTVCTPICGDGLVVGTEACDDHNTTSCGGCNNTCTMTQAPAAATGSITTVSGNNLRDGETVTISDGTHVVTFEFDVSNTGSSFNGVAGGHVQVKAIKSGSNADSAHDMAVKLATAINNYNGTFRVTATPPGASPAHVVGLTNDALGAGGNAAIVPAVANNGFTVTGMSNGADADCLPGVGCTANTDCSSHSCVSNLCATATCGDGAQNGGETGVDCGGPCTPCGTGVGCNIADDCISGVCTSGSCAAPSCTDGVHNGTEGDVDCGGTCATKCDNGDTCGADADCRSVSCSGGLCIPSCSDLFQDGSETDVDCGGSCSTKCADGDGCAVNGDCTSGLCDTAAPTKVCLTTWLVTVTNSDNTIGTVTSNVVPAISCGTTCAQRYADGSSVTLTATGMNMGTFDHWEGGPCDLSTTATCTFTLTAAVTTKAVFN